jgi:hypothetical protein
LPTKFTLSFDARQKHETCAETTWWRQTLFQFIVYDTRQELVRQRGQDASAITGIGFGSNSASMIHVLQNLIGILQDRVTSLPPNMGNKTDPAAVVLKGRVIKSAPARSFKHHWVAIGIVYLIHEYLA